MLPRLITTALATYRLTRLITEDVITEPLRDAIFDRFGDPSTDAARYTLSYAVTCPHCAGLYSAAVAALLTYVADSPALPAPIRIPAHLLVTALATAGAVSIYHDTLAATPHTPNTAGGWAS